MAAAVVAMMLGAVDGGREGCRQLTSAEEDEELQEGSMEEAGDSLEEACRPRAGQAQEGLNFMRT